jgi:hypothetical protein
MWALFLCPKSTTGGFAKMKTYRVTITETLETEVTVEAGNREEAERIVKEDWQAEKYVLDSSCFSGVNFKAKPLQREREYER